MGVFSKKSDVIEAGRAYRLDMTPLCEMQYSVPGVAQVRLPDFNEPYILIHSHPDGRTFSPQDIIAFLNRSNLKMLMAVGNDGAVYAVEKQTHTILMNYGC